MQNITQDMVICMHTHKARTAVHTTFIIDVISRSLSKSIHPVNSNKKMNNVNDFD